MSKNTSRGRAYIPLTMHFKLNKPYDSCGVGDPTSTASLLKIFCRLLIIPTPTRHILPTILVPAHPGFANTSCKCTFSMLQTFFTRTFTFFMQHMLMLRTRWPNFFHARNVDYRPASAERSAR